MPLTYSEFDAPRHLVFRAWTTPDLIKKWWSGDRGEGTSAEVDLRVGGSWRDVMTANGGFQVAFHGVYREIVADEKIVATEVFEAMPDGEAVDTATFTDIGGRTRLTCLAEHQSREIRDLVIGSGMEDGMQEAMDHLEQVTISLARSSWSTPGAAEFGRRT